MPEKSIFQSLRDVSDQIESLFLKIFKGTFLYYERPDVKMARRLRSVGLAEDDILPLIKNLYIISRMVGSAVSIDDMACIVIHIHCKGLLSKDDFMDLRYRGVNMTPALSRLKGVEEDDIRYMIKSGKISSDDFLRALKLYVNGEYV